MNDAEVKVIVLAGEGKHFSAGHDIGTPGRDVDVTFDRRAVLWWDHTDRAGGDQRFARESEVYLGMCRRWREIPKPMIASVQGACIAGGLMLAWVCDLIVASDDAFFADPVVRMGIPGVEYFAHPWVLGPRAAKEVLFTGERFTVQQAKEWGMVNRIVPRAELAAAHAGAGGEDQRDAAVRAGAGEEGRQPGRGPDGAAVRNGLRVRAAPPGARAQRGDLGRLARRAVRTVDARREQGGVMDLDIDEASAAFRDEAREWLADARRGSLPSMDTAEGFAAHREWEAELAEARWSVVSWPREYHGRDASMLQWLLFEEEYYASGAPGRVSQNGIFMLGPTLFAHGTQEQRDRILPAMARGEQVWAQAWSEPEAGSDIAALRSTAVRTDGGWLLSGQKTWSSRAAFADRAFGLFRTDPDAQRHHGLTYFMADLRADGVTVRPIPQLDGEPGFAEIFFDEVFVPDEDVIGEVGTRLARRDDDREQRARPVAAQPRPVPRRGRPPGRPVAFPWR